MISVIIPSYRPGLYVEECILSVMNQTLETDQYEVLVILNGDKEPYYSKLMAFIKPYSNVSLIYSSVPGVSHARNLGIERSTGDYICFVDDDDLISTTYLEELLSHAGKDVMSISQVYSFTTDPRDYGEDFFICSQLRNKEKYLNASFYTCRSFFSFPVAKMIHRDAIANHRFDIRFKNGEDALFMTSITDNIKSIDFTSPKAAYFVRLRKGSASRHKIPVLVIVSMSLRLMSAYIATYFKNPSKFSLKLFLSRIPGVMKNAFILAKNRD